MWERMFDLVLGLKKEHRLMMVITLIYAVTLFGITVDVEAMENWKAIWRMRSWRL